MLNRKSKLCIGMGMLCLLITQIMAYSLDSSKTMDKQSNQNVNHQRVLVSSALHYNGNGNMSTDNKGASFSYNAANALTQVSLASGAKESEYYYANGLRAVAQSNTQVLVHYYSRHNQLLNTSDGAQQSSAYLIANNVAVRSVNGNVTVLLHNRHGSVIGQLGDKSQFYQYSVYGVQRTEDGGQKTDNGSGLLDLAINPLRYSGYMFDPLTGLYYLKARDYDPHLRSFIQADSYAFNNQGLINGYYYSNNNPVMGIDPSGHAPLPDIDWGEVQHFLQAKDIADITEGAMHLGGGAYGDAYKVHYLQGSQDFVVKIYKEKGLQRKLSLIKEYPESPAQRDARVLNRINAELNGDDKFASTIRLSDGNDYLVSKYVEPTKVATLKEELKKTIGLKITSYVILDYGVDGNITLTKERSNKKGLRYVPYILDADHAVMKMKNQRSVSPISKKLVNSLGILVAKESLLKEIQEHIGSEPDSINGSEPDSINGSEPSTYGDPTTNNEDNTSSSNNVL
ncbi:RHS repeat-associated core domain-containing protein [Cysteiniphilum halobium]|uniref:RHS repeat-associated core domain-containing protein n=1 Tax=Cysteiniphilum halobium TaxID=2219059 RepID=UPI0013C2A186|nr:RHS repeat-associated core domain-containing protein [Cysteiniphilum halobium]